MHRTVRNGATKRRQHVAPPVPARPVGVRPPVVGGQQPVQRREQVRIAARAQFHQRQARRGVRHEHVQQPVPPAGCRSRNSAHSPVISSTVSRPPVRTRTIKVFISNECGLASPRRASARAGPVAATSSAWPRRPSWPSASALASARRRRPGRGSTARCARRRSAPGRAGRRPRRAPRRSRPILSGWPTTLPCTCSRSPTAACMPAPPLPVSPARSSAYPGTAGARPRSSCTQRTGHTGHQGRMACPGANGSRDRLPAGRQMRSGAQAPGLVWTTLHEPGSDQPRGPRMAANSRPTAKARTPRGLRTPAFLHHHRRPAQPAARHRPGRDPGVDRVLRRRRRPAAAPAPAT